MIRSSTLFRHFIAVAALVALSPVAQAQTVGPDPDQLAKCQQRAVNFLMTSQAADGTWTSPQSPAITGLVCYSLLRSGVGPDEPHVQKAIKSLETFIQPDGGLYAPKSYHGNYETAIAVLVLSEANKDGRYAAILEKANKYLRGLQWDESEKIDQSDVRFGGAGYGRTGDRPDLSNTSFFLDALEATGASQNDTAVKNAIFFLSRCQNLETEFNQTPAASKINDGGFYYTPATGGNSQAGNTDNGGLRSYGSMTYAGLKSMVFAGLTPEDKRVRAALEWIEKHYTVQENPGMGTQGLYYYYHVFSKALSTMKMDYLTDNAGKKHDWRKDLAEHLMTLQQENGSWINKNDRWYEGDPNLATAFALMSLKYCEPAHQPAAAK
jgi:squalene-hopene/tetraprenyl-beta-curcumene cyclase